MARYRQWMLLVASGVGMLMPAYWARLWGAGHYQYFPLVFLSVAFLLWAIQDRMAEEAQAPNHVFTTSLLILLSVLLCLANLLYSNILCILAISTAIIAALYLIVGGRGLKVALPVLSLLVFVIPLPLRFDEWLIIKLQLSATDYASRLLDLAGVIHLRQGVLLQTYQKQFLTEEACSGIRSLFSSWALVSIYGVAMGHRWWRVLFNLVQTVPWVFVGNVLRLTAVVAFADQAPWISSGWGHEFFGLVVSIFILSMIATGDFAISELLRTELAIVSVTDRPILPLNFADRSMMIDESAFHGWASHPRSSLEVPFSPLASNQQKILVACLVVVTAVSIRTAWLRAYPANYQPPAAYLEVSTPDAGVLPVDLVGMNQESFEHINRGPSFLWAKNSYVWTYADDELQVVISLDRPWDQWHNLNVCYSSIGWTTEAKLGVSMPDGLLQAAMPEYRHSELSMKRAYEWAFVVFSTIDQKGGHVQEPESAEPFSLRGISSNLLARLRAGLGWGEQSASWITSDRLPLETIQLYAKSSRPLTPQDHDKLREIFSEARRSLVAWKTGPRR